MKRGIKLVSITAIFMLLTQLLPGFVNTAYADVPNVIFHYSAEEEDFNDNMLEGLSMQEDYNQYANDDSEWTFGDMASAWGRNSSGTLAGWYPIGATVAGQIETSRYVYVDLGSIASLIDNGEVYFEAYVDMGNNAYRLSDTSDTMFLTVKCCDRNRVPMDSHTQTVSKNPPCKEWANLVTVPMTKIPEGTRYLRYEVKGRDDSDTIFGDCGMLVMFANPEIFFYDLTSPTVKRVTMSAADATVAPVDGTSTVILGAEMDMDFTVEFSEPVKINHDLVLNLKYEDSDTNGTISGTARFNHNNAGDIQDGNKKFVFHGSVPSGVKDGMKLKVVDITWPNGSPATSNIRDYSGNAAPDLDGLSLSGKPVKIDINPPEIVKTTNKSGGGTYKKGADIEFQVKFSESVIVPSNSKLVFENGAVNAAYQSGSGTDTIKYTYTVGDGDNFDGLQVTGISGTVQDITGKDLVEPAHTYDQLPRFSYVKVDTIGPDITFTNADGSIYGEKGTYKKEHQVYITSTDDVTGPDHVYYYWDTTPQADQGGDWKDIANGTAPVENPANITGENYYLHSKATDEAGNESFETEGPFCFDNENPSITLNPESGENQASYDVRVTAADERAGIKEIGYTWYRVTDGENSELSSGTVENGALLTSPDMGGSYRVKVEAEDNAGNTASKTSGDYRVDKSLPSAVFSTRGSDTGIKAVSVDVTISDDSSIKNGYYQWSSSVAKPAEDDPGWTEFFTGDSLDPVSSYTGAVSSGEGKNGIWYLHVKCVDASGNVGIYTTGDGFKLDNENPDLSFSPNGNSSPQQEFTTYLQVNNESYGYTVGYEISTNSTSEYIDSELTEYTPTGEGMAFTLDAGTGDNETGTYYIHAKVEDTAGNASTLSSGPIYIDNTPPDGSVVSNDAHTNQSPVQLVLSAEDTYPEGADEDILMRISHDGGAVWNEWIPFSQAQNVALAEEKEYDIAVQYSDAAGNESEVYHCSIVYDITVPEIDSVQYNSGWTNQDLPVTVIFNDITASQDMVIEIIDSETTAEAAVQNNVITFKGNGICGFKYRDQAGNENTGSIMISNFDKTGPQISVSPDGNDNESRSVTAQVTAADNVTAAQDIGVDYCWSQSSTQEPGDWQAVASGGTVEKSDGNGKWHLWVRASDSLGNSSIFTSRAFNLDNKKPKASNITYNPPTTTANNVTARVEFDENVKIVSPVSTSEYANSFEYTFHDNGTESITFKDKAGNENSCMLEVDWIDRSLPSADENYSSVSWTNEPIVVTVTADDEQYSLYNFKPYVDGKRVPIKAGNSSSTVTECVYNWNSDSGIYVLSGYNDGQSVGESVYGSQVVLTDVTVSGDGAVTRAEFKFNENGYMDYGIKRLDTGLTGEGQIVVDKIDVEKPEAVLTYTSKNSSWNDEADEIWTNEDIEVTLQTSDNSGQPVEILNNNGSGRYVFDANGSFDFLLEDAAGNRTTVTASAHRIDKEKPAAALSYTSGDKSWDGTGDEEWTNQDVEVIMETSDNSGQPVEILNNDGSNKHTFTQNGSFTFRIRDAAGNESETAARVSRIDREAPNPVIAYNTQEWTKGNVEVSISFDNESGDVNILNNDASSQYTFTQNGAFTFEFEDAAGNGGEITVVVNNIDKDIPQVNEIWYSTKEPTNGKVIARVYTNENVEFLTDNGADNYTFEDNGSHEFRFEDRAGNENSATAQVGNIDRTPPNAWIEYSTTETTNSDVIAELKADEEIKVINNLNKDQYVFTQNGEFTFIYEDLAGNGGEITAVVENIDTSLPAITLEYSESGPTQNDVTVTITSDKDITPVNYTGNTVIFTKNETKWLKALDPFGEEFYFEVAVGNIDKEAPQITFSKGENLIIGKDSGFDPLADVSITDNLDEEIGGKLTAAHNVDVNTEGEYEITYAAADSAGNSISVTRKAMVVSPDNFTAFVNSSEAGEDEMVTRGKGISLELFGIEGDCTVKWLEGKKSKGDFKECEEYCEGGYMEIEESGYYTLLIQDQERNTKLLHVYVIYSN